MSAYVSIRHMSAYVCIRLHTSAYVSIRTSEPDEKHAARRGRQLLDFHVEYRFQHVRLLTSAYVSVCACISQHTTAYATAASCWIFTLKIGSSICACMHASIRQHTSEHTSAYVSAYVSWGVMLQHMRLHVEANSIPICDTAREECPRA